MWECPDYFTQNGKGVMILSPQGMESQGDLYNNIFQSGYLIGEEIDWQNGVFKHGSFVELDRGFEFYAPQTMQDPSGRRILVGWFGLPGVDCVSDENGWAHCLTIPRELIVEENRLWQRPIKELEQLRKEAHTVTHLLQQESISFEKINGIVYELTAEFTEIEAQVVGINQSKTCVRSFKIRTYMWG